MTTNWTILPATPPLIAPSGNFKTLAIGGISNVSMNNINNVADPVLSLDAANKEYVDSSVATPGGIEGSIQLNNGGGIWRK